MTEKKPISLYEAKKHSVFIIVSIPQMQVLENMGLRPGTDIIVKSRYRLGGPVLVRIRDSCDLAIGKDIARQITVKEGKPEA